MGGASVCAGDFVEIDGDDESVWVARVESVSDEVSIAGQLR